MDSSEKNKISSVQSEFDQDFRHDRYDQAREDREFQKGHKRVYDNTIEPDYRKGVHHDPYNTGKKDFDRHNQPLNKPTDMDGRDINREESPTTRDMHHLYIPEAKVKQPKDKPYKYSHEKKVDITSDQQKVIKRDIYDTEKIHNKQVQFPNVVHPHPHNNQSYQSHHH